MQEQPPQNKVFEVPHTYIIVSAIIVVMAVMTWFIPAGKFATKTISYEVIQNNQKVQKQRTVPVRESFAIVTDEDGNKVYPRKGIGDVLMAPFQGFTDHSAMEVIAFILLIGGAFGILIRTRAVEATLLRIIAKAKGSDVFLIPVVMILFSLGGAVFGMAEETIPFTMILVPIVIAMGYDSITGVCVGFVASQIGFTTAFMNPFTLGIAQGIAGVPYMSGFYERLAIWAIFTTIGIVVVMLYARKVKKDPTSSPTYKIDEYWRRQFAGDEDIASGELHSGHILIMTCFALCMIWLVYGVIVEGYYLAEISMVFFAVGVLSGAIAIAYKMMRLNEVARAFETGAADLLTAAIIVGFAKGIVYVMGGSEATEPSILNTTLYYVSEKLSTFSPTVCAVLMYCFQSIFNFFVVSGSGQAALTMPLMSPLGQMVGVSNEVTILAFQFGDGVTNMIVPTSSVLIGVLSVAKIPWTTWAKWQMKMQALYFVLCVITLIIMVSLGFGY